MAQLKTDVKERDEGIQQLEANEITFSHQINKLKVQNKYLQNDKDLLTTKTTLAGNVQSEMQERLKKDLETCQEGMPLERRECRGDFDSIWLSSVAVGDDRWKMAKKKVSAIFAMTLLTKVLCNFPERHNLKLSS